MRSALTRARRLAAPLRPVVEWLESRRFLSTAATVTSQSAPTPYGSDSALAGYQLAWHDEFNGNSVDTAAWTYRTDAKSLSTQTPGNVSESGGALRIALRRQPIGTTTYTGGGVISRQTFQYGYYEARVKTPAGAGWHTSFWTQRYNGTDTAPTNAQQEIDIVEQNSSTRSQYDRGLFDWTTGTPLGRATQQTGIDLSGGYHVYGASFTPSRVQFFFDGRSVGSVDVSALPKGPQNIWLTAIATKPVDESKLPETAAVDYARFFAPPSSTPVPPPAQSPFKGTPFAVGATTATTIQAEGFDKGGEGVAYHDVESVNRGGAYRLNDGVDIEATADSGGGYHVGYTKPGEWVEYTVNVAASGTYTLDTRVSSKGLGGTFRLYVDGADKTGALQVPDTTAWNTFQDVLKTGVSLTAGAHVLRLGFDSVGASGFAGNFNYIKLTPTSIPKTLTTSTVAYAQDGASSGSNFGSSSQVQVKKTTQSGYNREGFLKFDVSGVSVINSAKLRLFGNLGDAQNASVQTQVFGSPNTSWTESGITWNNRPATGGSALSTATVTGTTAKWYELDVTSYLKAQKAAGVGQVTFVLRNPNASNSVVQFNSDDAASNRPQIAIT